MSRQLVRAYLEVPCTECMSAVNIQPASIKGVSAAMESSPIKLDLVTGAQKGSLSRSCAGHRFVVGCWAFSEDLHHQSPFGCRAHTPTTACSTQYITLYPDSQVAGNNRPLYSKVDYYWSKVAHNYEPLALQVDNMAWSGGSGRDILDLDLDHLGLLSWADCIKRPREYCISYYSVLYIYIYVSLYTFFICCMFYIFIYAILYVISCVLYIHIFQYIYRHTHVYMYV